LNPKGRVLLIAADQALLTELTPTMVGHEYELVSAADARQAVLKLANETFVAVVADFAKVPPADRESLAKVQLERGGFALFGLEPAAPLSPASAAALRRMPWPLPRGFMDQVRAVEVPVVPEQLPQLKTMCVELDRLGVPFLNIHELFLCAENEGRVLAKGEKAKAGGESKHLLWRPTAKSLESCLELLLFAQENCRTLSVYLCSCGTQENISKRGYRRRRRQPAG